MRHSGWYWCVNFRGCYCNMVYHEAMFVPNVDTIFCLVTSFMTVMVTAALRSLRCFKSCFCDRRFVVLHGTPLSSSAVGGVWGEESPHAEQQIAFHSVRVSLVSLWRSIGTIIVHLCSWAVSLVPSQHTLAGAFFLVYSFC